MMILEKRKLLWGAAEPGEHTVLLGGFVERTWKVGFRCHQVKVTETNLVKTNKKAHTSF